MNRRAFLLSGSSLLLAAGAALVTGATFAQGIPDVADVPAPAMPDLPDAPAATGSDLSAHGTKSPVKPPPGNGFCPVCGAPLPVARAANGAAICTGHACHG